VTSRTQISVILSQYQQQPFVSIPFIADLLSLITMHDVTATVGITLPYRALENLKICRHKNVILMYRTP